MPTGECGSANDIKGQIQKNQGQPFYKLHVGPATPNPDGAFVAQQARNLYMSEEPSPLRFLIRDRDSTFIRPFDEVFTSEGARVIKTPVRAPEANAFAERFVRTVRHEVFDLTLVLDRRDLDRSLRRYAQHYDEQRPHRPIEPPTPDGAADREVTWCASSRKGRCSWRSDPRVRAGRRVMGQRKRTLHAHEARR